MQSSLTFPKIPGHNLLKITAGSPGPARPGAPDTNDARKLVEALKQSRFYREYGEAFTKMTGLPLSLFPANPAPSNLRTGSLLNVRFNAASLARSSVSGV